MIGAVPPAALSDWRYIAVFRSPGWLFFFIRRRIGSPLLIFDGAGLAFFAVSGALKALSYGLMPFAAIMLGVLTGVGGGIVRDILVSEIPTVLRAELYAVAALAGASVVVSRNMLQLPFGRGAGAGSSCALDFGSWRFAMAGIYPALVLERPALRWPRR